MQGPTSVPTAGSSRERFFALLSPAVPENADVLFLAEGDGLNRTAYTAELYKNKYAPQIVAVGGASNREYGSFLSLELKQLLVEQGVPESAILAEETAMHTKAETDRLMELAREHGWKRVLLVTSPHHQYRLLLTAVRSMRNAGLELTLMNAPAPLSWFAENPWGRRIDLLDGELERIHAYQEKGDIASFDQGIEYLEQLYRA